MDERLPDDLRPGTWCGCQVRNGIGVICEFVERLLLALEVRPPLRLGLSPVVRHEIREQRGRRGPERQQAGLARSSLSVRCRLPRRRRRYLHHLPRNRLPSALLGLPLSIHQPVAELARGQAVFLVVRRDGVENRGVAGVAPPLELENRLPATGHGDSPRLRHEERPHRLEGIATL